MNPMFSSKAPLDYDMDDDDDMYTDDLLSVPEPPRGSAMRNSLIQYQNSPRSSIQLSNPPSTTAVHTGSASPMRRMPIVTTSSIPSSSNMTNVHQSISNDINQNLIHQDMDQEANISQISYSQDPSFHQETHDEDGNEEHSIIAPGELSEEVEVNTSAIFSDEASHDVESLTEKLNDVTNYLRKEIMVCFQDSGCLRDFQLMLTLYLFFLSR